MLGRRPALVCCAGCLLGLLAGPWGAAALLAWIGAAIGIAAIWGPWSEPGQPCSRRVLLALTVAGFLLGVAAVSASRPGDSTLRPPGVLAGDRADPGDYTGVVSRAPEIDLDGGRRFQLELEFPGEAARWRVAVEVAPSPADAWPIVDRLVRGERVRLWGRLSLTEPRPGEEPAPFGRRRSAAGVVGRLRVKSGRLVEPAPGVTTPPWTAAAAVDRLRRLGRARLDLRFEGQPELRGLAGAMLLGDRAGLAPSIEAPMRDAGLSHLVAISGLHVGLLIGLLLRSLRRVGLRGPPLLAIALPALWVFGDLVGGRSSVLRAVVTAGAVLAGRSLGRQGERWNTLAFVATLLLLSDPVLLWTVGFQLTFAATAGILSAVGRRKADGLPAAWGVQGIRISIAAYASTSPLVAFHFQQVAPAGILTNLVAVPLCAVALPTGYASLLLGGVPGERLAAVCRGALGLLVELSGFTAAVVPARAVAAPEPFLVGLALLSVPLAMFPWQRRFPRRLAPLGAVLLALAVFLGPPPRTASGRTELAMIDVGQGLSVALRAPDGELWLVDAGPRFRRFDAGERRVVPYLLGFAGRRVSVLVLSHGDLDHVGGAPALLRRLEIGSLWIGPDAQRSPRLREIRDAAIERGVAVRLVEAGVVAGGPEFEVRVMAPDRSGAARRNSNDGSLVLLAGRAPTRVLLPGDIGEAQERRLGAGGRSCRAELLVVGHHGSAGSSHERWLRDVAPALGLISCGRRNAFGHPSPETLQRLRQAGVAVYRTDRQGTLLVRATPDGWVR